MANKKYEVFRESAGGVRRAIDQFDTEQEAIEFCASHDWIWIDENCFEWSLDYKEVSQI